MSADCIGRVCFVTANTFALNAFLAGPIGRLAADGWEVTVVLNTSDGTVADAVQRIARVVAIPHVRAIAPGRDLRNLFALWRLLRRERFDVVHSLTPKAGLLAMLAARAAGTPRRIHTFTGQVWATRRGAMRRLLRRLDRVIAACATEVLADSPSQRDFMVAEGVAPAQRIRVLREGSICGVDGGRFRPDPALRAVVRGELGIAAQAQVLLYVGRLHPEKGLLELAQAFEQLVRSGLPVHLVLAGPDEGALGQLQRVLRAGWPRVRLVGRTAEPERLMAAADVFCLPSYREGFGLSLLEAAAAGVPSVATRIYGITDAVADGETGLLVPARDPAALAQALQRLLRDPALRARLGVAARARAAARFSADLFMQAWSELYAPGRAAAG